jgi:hypothetical protein
MLDLVMVAQVMLRVLGPETPEARAAGEEALTVLRRMGAKPLIAQVEAAMAGSGAGAGETRPTRVAG